MLNPKIDTQTEHNPKTISGEFSKMKLQYHIEIHKIHII